MALSFYTDPALTSPTTSSDKYFDVDGSTGARTFSIFYGDPVAGSVYIDADDPYVNEFTITPNDTQPAAEAGIEWVKLALTEAGLDSAVAGAPLTITSGGTLTSGAAGAKQIWIRMQPVGTPPWPEVDYDDIELVANDYFRA